MKKYPWWTDFQKKLADETESFVDEWFPPILFINQIIKKTKKKNQKQTKNQNLKLK